MGSPTFDFSALTNTVSPLIQALASRFPELLDAQVKTATMAPEMQRFGMEQTRLNNQAGRLNAAMALRSDASTKMAAEALARRKMDEDLAAVDRERARETEFVGAEHGRLQGLASRYGGGLVTPGAALSPAMLAYRGQLGGTAYRGSSLDDSNPERSARESDDYNRRRCAIDPNGPGCDAYNGGGGESTPAPQPKVGPGSR